MLYKRINELLGTEYENDSRIDWKKLCYVDRMLPESFLEEFKDKIEWKTVSIYQVLSEDFIRRHKDLVNWDYISRYQLLSWNFILEFRDKVSWEDISRYQPFIDLEYSKIDKEALKDNNLCHLYQETRERGWFLCFRRLSINRRERKFYYISHDIRSYCRRYKYIKIRVYWKDLVKINVTKKYEPIREVKYV